MADLCTNPGFETNTTGWTITGAGETITRVTSESHSGSASCQVTTDASATAEGTYFQVTHALAAGRGLTVRIWAKGAGVVRCWAYTRDGGGTYIDVVKSGDITLSGTWQQLTSSLTASALSTSLGVMVRTTENQAPQAVTFYIDDAEIIVPDSPTATSNMLLLGVG